MVWGWGERISDRCEMGGMTIEVGLAVDVSVGMWEPIGMEVTVNEGQDSVL